MKIKIAAVLMIFMVVVFCAGGIWLFISYPTSASQPKNVVLISIDICRADRLGCYGFKGKIIPNIDAIAI